MQQRVVIVGGGVIGSAIAYFLMQLSEGRVAVTVTERDASYLRSSSALSAGSIRQQFSTPANIEMSLYGIEFLRSIGEHLEIDGERPDIGLIEPGYLFLASAAGVVALRANHALQTAFGADIGLLGGPALQERFPWLSLAGVAAGALGVSGEGWFDGYGLMLAFRRKARALGARFVEDEVIGLDYPEGRIVAALTAAGSRLECDTLVNAAGPWAAQVATMAGIALPVRARRRSVFYFNSPAELQGCPLVIDPSGAYFRPEGRGFICGISPAAENDPDDLPLEADYAMFNDVLWPLLATRVPQFEALRLAGAWAGYYECNVFDHNAVIGRHPEISNFVFANGFSGHGLQHSPAAGRGVAELILHGAYRSLDLSPFHFERIALNAPIFERNVV